jgi:hypothetical protein
MAVTHAAGGTHPDGTRMLDDREQSGSEAARHGFVGFTARNSVRNDD